LFLRSVGSHTCFVIAVSGCLQLMTDPAYHARLVATSCIAHGLLMTWPGHAALSQDALLPLIKPVLDLSAAGGGGGGCAGAGGARGGGGGGEGTWSLFRTSPQLKWRSPVSKSPASTAAVAAGLEGGVSRTQFETVCELLLRCAAVSAVLEQDEEFLGLLLLSSGTVSALEELFV
jgi:hypothetical protein